MTGSAIKIVQLPGRFVQVQLAGLKDIVDHHRENDEKVKFDASDVERIDGAAVQFLVAVSQLQVSDETGGPLVQNANEVLVKAIEDLGVSELITFEVSDSDSDSDSESEQAA